MKKTLAVIGCCLILFCSHQIFAQTESTMHFMRSLPQVTYYNPAFKPDYQFSFGLPGSSVFAQYINNGFTYNDFISRENNILTADLNKLYTTLRDQNYINANVQADLLRISFKAGARLYFTANLTAKGYNRFMLPKDLTGLFINGTGAYVNNTATLAPEAESVSYVEIGWGAAYTVNQKLTVGAKLKVLKGGTNVTSERASFNLTLSDTYAITVTGDADIRTSGIHNFDEPDFDVGDDWNDFLKNSGVAIDLGATYKPLDKLTVGLSLIDLGGITWKNDLYGYKLDPAKARYTFEGVDIGDLLNDEAQYGESLADSLEAKFDFTEGRIGSYRTPLPGKIYASAAYEWKRNLTVGGLFFAERFRGRFMPGFTASLNKEFGKRMGASLSYTITNNSFNNIGAGVSFNFSPVQFFIVGDNLLRMPFAESFFNSMQYFNIRTGINFVFGRDHVQEKIPTSNSSAR